LADQVFRVLSANGKWIIHVPNGESPFVGASLFGDITHETAFTRKSLTQLMSMAGFTRVKCFEDTPIPHGAKSFMRLVLWKLLRLILWGIVAVETGNTTRDKIFSQNLLAVVMKADITPGK
jgi:hypothetical protein